jgi:hypothetical protein
MRGARDGWLGDISPERTDPEWVSVWSLAPVGIYATVAPTNDRGIEQPAHIAHHDYPPAHFAHDWNLQLVPDPDYMWVLGTVNFLGEADDPETGRIELEWETQNNGTPFVGSVDHGKIGMPSFAMATVGDRVYTVGRWVLDNGHPEKGNRSEIHPPRMIATMRKRPAVVPLDDTGLMTRAAQVDVFVSGNGGGINVVRYVEMEKLLDNNGLGGGRIIDYDIGLKNDLKGNALGSVYQRYGPDPVINNGIGTLVDIAGIFVDIPEIHPTAGPSAFSTDLAGMPMLGTGPFPWKHGDAFEPVNDMDYEFVVPLPPRPPGATTPRVQVTKQAMDSTSVNEIITYAGNFAHVRLPYKGADNGIYARTYKFYWDTYSPPGNHFIVQLNEIRTARAYGAATGVFSGPQPLYLWADVCGQWRFVTGMFQQDNNPLLTPAIGSDGDFDMVSLDGFQQARFDCYLTDTDTLRVYVGGYAQRDLDGLFGNAPAPHYLYNYNAYDAGIQVGLAVKLGSGDNQNIGGAVFDRQVFDSQVPPASLDHYDVVGESSGVTGNQGGPFPTDGLRMTFTTTYVQRQPRILASTDQLSFGTACPESSQDLQLQISNGPEAQSALVVNNFSLTGSGFSLVSPPALPLTLAPGASQSLTIRFAPTTSGTATGILAIGSNDPMTAQFPVTLSGLGGTPTIQASANVARTPTLVFATTTRSGDTSTWAVTISNSGECSLKVHPTLSGTGGTWKIVLPSGYYNPFTGTLIKDIVIPPGDVNTDLKVTFTPTVNTFKAVGILALGSNDPQNPTTKLTFGAEGVPVGMRVVVVGGDGMPYPVVDSLKLKSSNKVDVNTHIKDVPLTTIDPPDSWQRIQFHYMTGLDPAEGGSNYTLEVKVGNMKKKLDFTLAPGEFQELTVMLP